jgi:carbon-monoxide dehydrogenase medium subunit
LVTHRRLEVGSDLDGALGALVRTTAHAIGHLPIRTRGTFGGSIAHADPAAEWCLLARTLDAEVELRSAKGTRTVAASDLFVTVFTTTIDADEVLTSVSLPMVAPTCRVGFSEFSRRSGDFALAAAMTVVDVRDDVVVGARIGLGAVADVPVRATDAETALTGQRFDATTIREAAHLAAMAVTPAADIHGSTEFRQDLVRAMVERALVRDLSPVAA